MVLHTCQGSFKIQGSGFRVLGFGLCQDMRFRVQDLAMGFGLAVIWVVVKIMVPFWVLIIGAVIFRVPKKGP